MSDSPRRGSLLVIFLTVFIDLLGFGIVLPLLPVYGKDFAEHLGWAENDWQIGALIGLLMASFSAMQFVFAPLWGRLSDRIGRRPVLMIGLFGSVVFYTIFGVATVMKSLTGLFVARIGAGIAGATISTAQAYIADTTTLETRTKGMALIGAAFGLGFTFGPLFGFLAVPSGSGDPGPGPGYAAAALSAFALLLAWFKLPESLPAGGKRAERKIFNFRSLADGLSIPTVGLLLATVFVCVFSFANFESTLSVFIEDEQGPFAFSYRGLCLTFAFIGLVLTLVQGGIVRRVAGRVSEVALAATGAAVEIAGFLLLARAGETGSLPLLWVALTLVVSGFAFLTPSLNSLISRRSDPAKQGSILGVTQSINSLARILGPMAGLTLFELRPPASSVWPLWLAAGLMVGGLLMILLAARGGRDYAAEENAEAVPANSAGR
jgi:MFS family permease